MVGSIDPNPIVAGKGLRILEENGVEVVYDVMRAECDAINRHFFHYITTGMGCGRNVDKSTFLDPFSYLTNDLTIAIMCFVNRRHKFRKEDDSSSAVVPQDGTPIFCLWATTMCRLFLASTFVGAGVHR